MTDIEKESLEAARIISKYCTECETCIDCIFKIQNQYNLYECVFNDHLENPPSDWRLDKV